MKNEIVHLPNVLYFSEYTQSYLPKGGRNIMWPIVLLLALSGEYRLVMEVDVSGLKQKLASGNTLIIAGEPETAIESTTWGFVKARR